jgi:natural product precursor
MKKINLKSVSISLTNKEMKQITGGNRYRCCCGMGSNVNCFDVYADGSDTAVSVLPHVCGNSGGGCFLS